jgi:TatA/E family protein of Tat protein translocase
MPTPGPLELVIILVVALLVLGPGKLPEVGSALGKSIREFRKAASDVQEATKIDMSPLPPTPAAPAPAVPAVAPAPVAAPLDPIVAAAAGTAVAAPVAVATAAPSPAAAAEPAATTPQPGPESLS